MKQSILSFYTLAILFGFLLTMALHSCIIPQSEVGEKLDGTHNLKQTSDGYYTYTFTKVDDSYEINKINFFWKDSSNTNVMTRLRQSDIRIELNDTIETPMVKFRWNSGSYDNNLERLENHIVYALIICNDESLPVMINKISKSKYLDLIKEPELFYEADSISNEKENIIEL